MAAKKISLDAGYDGIKVILENGITYKTPAEVVSERYHALPERLMSDDSTKNYVIMYGTDNERFAIGELAADIKRGLHGATDLDDLYIENASRYSNPNFKRLCLASIYCAIKKSDEITGKPFLSDNATIKLSVAVPNDYLKEVSDAVNQLFAGSHEFAIKIGDSEPEMVNLNISKVSRGSQTILSVIGYAGDDNGNIVGYNSDDFPLLSLDLGYGTAGIAYIDKGLLVKETESNKEFTMMRVNQRTAKGIQELTHISCTHRNIEMAVRSGASQDAIWKYEKGSEYTTINILEAQEIEVGHMTDELYEYIKKEYPITFIQNVLISGGTGTRFYPALCEKFTGNKLLAKENVHLAECKYAGKEYEPIYAVAVGGLKML